MRCAAIVLATGLLSACVDVQELPPGEPSGAARARSLQAEEAQRAADAFHAWAASTCTAEAGCKTVYDEASRRELDCSERTRPYDQPSREGCRGYSQDAETSLARLRGFMQQRVGAEAQAQAEEERQRDAADLQRAEAERARMEAERNAYELKGEAAVDRMRAEAERKAQLERSEAEEREAAREQEKAAVKAGKAVSQPPASGAGRVCCCDGTASPTCSYVHRGCCSHHGGVCGCD